MTTPFTTRHDANTAILDMGGKPGVTHYAQGNRCDGVDFFLVVSLASPLVTAGRPVRNERFVYTPSGKRNTSRNLCKRAFKKFSDDRAAFIAYATELGVKAATARAMFSHYTVGRYAAN